MVPDGPDSALGLLFSYASLKAVTCQQPLLGNPQTRGALFYVVDTGTLIDGPRNGCLAR
jgi:hypothetical protein